MGELIDLLDGYVPLSTRIAIARRNGVKAKAVITERGRAAVEISTTLKDGSTYVVGTFVYSQGTAEEKAAKIIGELGPPKRRVKISVEADEGQLTVGIVGDKSRFPILAGVDPVGRIRELLDAKGIDADIELIGEDRS